MASTFQQEITDKYLELYGVLCRIDSGIRYGLITDTDQVLALVKPVTALPETGRVA